MAWVMIEPTLIDIKHGIMTLAPQYLQIEHTQMEINIIHMTKILQILTNLYLHICQSQGSEFFFINTDTFTNHKEHHYGIVYGLH